jgi:hypothetical protein
MITQIYTSTQFPELISEDLELKVDLDLLVHVEQIIWNRSDARELKLHLKSMARILFDPHDGPCTIYIDKK